MCGGSAWEELGWKPFAALPGDFIVRLRDSVDAGVDDALQREAVEVHGAAAGRLPAGLASA
jgi:hypothetical protein